MQAVNSSPTPAPVTANPLQLKDIHVPEQISNYPIAYGWWLLAALLLLTLIFIGIKLYKRAKLKQAQQQALKQLKHNPNMDSTQVITLLKWAAMQYFPRAEIAKLYSAQLQQFLLEKLAGKYQQKFSDFTAHGFDNQYKKYDDLAQNTDEADKDFHQGALLWLSQALPPKIDEQIHEQTKQLNLSASNPAGAIK